MADLESLNSFFCDRLMAVAAEIFQVVKETVCQYQEETERFRQENVYLRKMLADVSNSNAAGTQTSQVGDFSPEQQNMNQLMLDSENSLIQVKLELSTMQQDLNLQQPLDDAPSCCIPSDPAKSCCNPANTDEDDVECLDSNAMVKLEDGGIQEAEACAEQNESPVDSNPHTSSSDVPHLPFHLQSPVAQKLFRSRMGQKTVKKSGHLKARKAPSHGQTRLRCDLCGKWYSTTHSLKLHLRTHTGERPFPCKFCVKTFHQKVHLKEHERTHTGEKPFGCSACDKLFSRSHQVKLHIQNHHPAEAASIIKRQQYA